MYTLFFIFEFMLFKGKDMLSGNKQNGQMFLSFDVQFTKIHF